MEFKISKKPVSYESAIKAMEKRVDDIIAGKADELIWFLEHPHVYTCGTSANPEKEILRDDVPVYKSGRGGKVTYHGPGQQVVYIVLDLRKRGKDIRKFVNLLEDWLARVLDSLGISSNTYDDKVGLWVKDPVNDNGDSKHNGNSNTNVKGDQSNNIFTESKIAAIGIRVRKWVTFHGISINNDPDLEYFKGIVPCGLEGYRVTSLKELGVDISKSELQKILKQEFINTFTKDDALKAA